METVIFVLVIFLVKMKNKNIENISFVEDKDISKNKEIIQKDIEMEINTNNNIIIIKSNKTDNSKELISISNNPKNEIELKEYKMIK